MTSLLEKIVRSGVGVFEGRIIENVKKVMNNYLPGSEDWDEKEFEKRLKQSMSVLPPTVLAGIIGPGLFLKNEQIFNYLHNLKSKEIAQMLSASRMPLALRIDDVPRIEREGPITTNSSLLDKEHYFENFEKQLNQKYDVIVVGSGPGGSEAAVAMLRQDPNLKVLVIEEGREYTPARLGAMTPSEVFAYLYTKGGVQYALGSGGSAFPLMTGMVVGGTSRINSGTFERVYGRFLNEVIERHFGGDKKRFENALLEVEKAYCVSRVPFLALNSTQQKYLPLALALGYEARTLNTARKGCTGRAACYQGCLIGAKKSPDNVGLVEILNRENAFLLGDTKVIKIETRRGKATAVAIRNKGRKYKIELEKNGVVVVAGGAIGSPKLLLNSGIPAGDQLLCHTQTEVYRWNPEPVNALKGLPQGIMVPLKCEGTAECAHPSAGVLALLATNLHGEALRRYINEYSQIEVLGAIVLDKPLKGGIRKVLGGHVIEYYQSEHDQRLIRDTVCEMMSIWASESGDRFFRTNVFPYCSTGDGKYAEMEKCGWIHQKYFDKYRNYLGNLDHLFPTSSVHLFGTTFKSIKNHTTGQLKGLDNVYVTDVSGMLQTKVNPQGTIFAVAHAKGERIMERW